MRDRGGQEASLAAPAKGNIPPRAPGMRNVTVVSRQRCEVLTKVIQVLPIIWCAVDQQQ